MKQQAYNLCLLCHMYIFSAESLRYIMSVRTRHYISHEILKQTYFRRQNGDTICERRKLIMKLLEFHHPSHQTAI